jgi:hypothetical protein
MLSNNTEHKGTRTDETQCASSEIPPNIEAEQENGRELNK